MVLTLPETSRRARVVIVMGTPSRKSRNTATWAESSGALRSSWREMSSLPSGTSLGAATATPSTASSTTPVWGAIRRAWGLRFQDSCPAT